MTITIASLIIFRSHLISAICINIKMTVETTICFQTNECWCVVIDMSKKQKPAALLRSNWVIVVYIYKLWPPCVKSLETRAIERARVRSKSSATAAYGLVTWLISFRMHHHQFQKNHNCNQMNSSTLTFTPQLNLL